MASIGILPGQILTDNDCEDLLVETLDQVIRSFLHRINRPLPYRTVFRWTFDNNSNLSYSVIVKIARPSPFI